MSVLALILILMKDLWNWWTRICQFPITAAQFTVDEYWELGIWLRARAFRWWDWRSSDWLQVQLVKLRLEKESYQNPWFELAVRCSFGLSICSSPFSRYGSPKIFHLYRPESLTLSKLKLQSSPTTKGCNHDAWVIGELQSGINHKMLISTGGVCIVDSKAQAPGGKSGVDIELDGTSTNSGELQTANRSRCLLLGVLGGSVLDKGPRLLLESRRRGINRPFSRFCSAA